MSKPIHQEIDFKANPKHIYEALMNDKEHGEFTGRPAKISRDVGGAFSCHGGHVVGRNVELVPNKRIVQAWRIGDWDDGVYSIVRFELKEQGSETRLILDHAIFDSSNDKKNPLWEAFNGQCCRSFTTP